MAEILIPAATAAELIGVSERTLRQMSRPRIQRLHIDKIAMYRESEILALKERRSQAASGAGNGADDDTTSTDN